MKTTANRRSIVIIDEYTRDIKDMRRKVSRAVYSYMTPCGVEFRRSFTLPPYSCASEFNEIAPLKIDVEL